MELHPAPHMSSKRDEDHPWSDAPGMCRFLSAEPFGRSICNHAVEHRRYHRSAHHGGERIYTGSTRMASRYRTSPVGSRCGDGHLLCTPQRRAVIGSLLAGILGERYSIDGLLYGTVFV